MKRSERGLKLYPSGEGGVEVSAAVIKPTGLVKTEYKEDDNYNLLIASQYPRTIAVCED